MKNLIYILSIIMLLIVIFDNCNQGSIAPDYVDDYSVSKNSFKEEGQLNAKPITLEAYFMQYACGSDNDDMKINLVEDTSYNFLLEKDIDPLLFEGSSEINNWFYHNKTEEYHMSFRLKGYVSKCAKSGCEGTVPKFWITDIEKIDGSKFKME